MVTNEQAIREAAYRKWKEAGAPEGDGVQFWLEAESECNCEDQERAEDEAIDEASEESFPASDPPARNSAAPRQGQPQMRRKK